MQSIAPGQGIVQALQGRRGTAQQDRAAFQLGPLYRDISRRVAEAVLLFERRIVFLINNDQTGSW